MVRALRPANAPPKKYLQYLKIWNGVPTRWEEWFLCPLMLTNKVRNVPASGNQGCSIASQVSWHVHGTLCWNPLNSAYLTFLASIFKTICRHVAKVRRCQKASSVAKGFACLFVRLFIHSFICIFMWILLGCNNWDSQLLSRETAWKRFTGMTTCQASMTRHIKVAPYSSFFSPAFAICTPASAICIPMFAI